MEGSQLMGGGRNLEAEGTALRRALRRGRSSPAGHYKGVMWLDVED